MHPQSSQAIAPLSSTLKPKSWMCAGASNASQYESRKLRFLSVHTMRASVGINALLRWPSLDACETVSVAPFLFLVCWSHLRLAPYASAREGVDVLGERLRVQQFNDSHALIHVDSGLVLHLKGLHYQGHGRPYLLGTYEWEIAREVRAAEPEDGDEELDLDGCFSAPILKPKPQTINSPPTTDTVAFWSTPWSSCCE